MRFRPQPTIGPNSSDAHTFQTIERIPLHACPEYHVTSADIVVVREVSVRDYCAMQARIFAYLPESANKSDYIESPNFLTAIVVAHWFPAHR